MPDLYNSDLGLNTRKVTPTDQFGTRKLAYLLVDATGLHTNYTTSNSLYSQVVRLIAQNVELYSAGVPENNQALFLVSADSMPETTNPDTPSRINDGESRNTYLESVLLNSGITCDVWNVRQRGDNITYNC
jgi:hypothetical protein